MTKRVIDILGASLGLIVLSPVFALLWVLIRIKLGAPVIFAQQRAGQNGESFTLYKFRTMLEPDPARGIIIDDQRMTPFGRRLRALSLDELPTLVNVLKGEMSLVGPRPLHLAYLPRYSAHQARRHEVRPGITGRAQVVGRNSLNWDERFNLDVQYVDEQSLWVDIKIIAQTIGRVFSRSDVEAEGASTMPIFTGSQPDDGLTEKLMSERWQQLWRTWQDNPNAVTTQGADTTGTEATRYWVYVDRDNTPLCIAGLSGLGRSDLTATILTNPQKSDTWFLPAVLNRLNLHGNFYNAHRLNMHLVTQDPVVLAAAHRAGFTAGQAKPAQADTRALQPSVLTLALTSEMRA